MGLSDGVLVPLAEAVTARLLTPLSGLSWAWSGGGGSSASTSSPVPPERGVGRIRRDYLRRLGIARAQAGGGPPAPASAVGPWQPAEGDAARGLGRCSFEVKAMDRLRQDDFRANFLRKLSYSGVLVPSAQRPPKSQTVIIFDWDDTLLCTSFLHVHKSRPLPRVVEQRLKEIAKITQGLLESACRLGQAFIITNASAGWVENSTATWVPELLPALRKVRIISARARYEPEFPGEVHQWKLQAFLEIQRQLDTQVITNLLSVGDSDYEMDAAHAMGKQFSQALIKTIKLQQQPSPDDLLKELVLVSQKFERIVENARNLKVCLERKVVGASHGS